MIRLRVALGVGIAVLILPLAIPLLRWQIFPYGDFGDFHVPMRFIYAEALRAGDSFLWTSWLESGLYVHAEGQSGMAHPIHLLIYRLLPLTAAVNLEMLAAYAMALVGMQRLLQRLGVGREAALGGSLVFAFGGFMLPHLNHLNVIVVVAHIPWVVYFAHAALISQAPRARAIAIAAVGLTIGSEALLGFPQAVWFTAIGLAWIALYAMSMGATTGRIALVALAAVGGLAMGGAQILPTLDATRESFRSFTTFDFRMSFSLHPWNLVQLVSPYVLHNGIYAPPEEAVSPHEFRLYASALGTASIGWILARRSSLPRPGLAVAFLALFAVSLLLTLGQYGGLYPLLARLPVLSGFRASTRHLVLVHFALAGLVALTLDDLLHGPAKRIPWWPLILPAALSVAVTLAVVGAAASLQANGVAITDGARVALGPAFAIATAALMFLAARGSGLAASLLIACLGVDLGCRSLPYVYREAPIPIRHLVPAIGRPPGSRPGDLVHPATSLDDRNRYPMTQRRTALAYLGIARSAVLDPEAEITQRIAGVSWTWVERVGWRPVRDPMPRVRLVGEWRTTTNPLADVAGIDPARVALVESGAQLAAGAPGEATLDHERPGRFSIRTRADSTQLLVVAERFHPGWTATVDGAPAALQRSYGDYMACVVPAGSHQVLLRFAPASWRQGLWISLAGLVAVGLLTLYLWNTSELRPALRTSPAVKGG